MLIQPFVAWRQAFPFLPTAGQALRSVELLAEMLADAAACRACGPAAVRSALQRIGGRAPPRRHRDHPGRRRRARPPHALLTGPLSPLPLPAAAAAYAVAGALILLPPALLALA
jgi:hypothetical protein